MIKNYRQLVPRYLISNKRTTISIVISILFSVMLLTSVGLIIGTYNTGRIEMAQQKYGKYYAGFRGVQHDLVDKLKNYDGISEIGTTMLIGNLQLDACKIEIKGADYKALDMFNANAISGRLPEKDYEIAIEQWVYNKMPYKPKPGEKFKLKYIYTDPNSGKDIQKETEFTFCGIIDDSYDSKMFQTGRAYVTMNTALSETAKYHRLFEQWFTLKSNRSIDSTLTDINKYANTKEHSYDNVINGYRPNIFLLSALKQADLAKRVTIFFDLIVAIVVIMVIYNVFSISVLQRKKQYGLLRAIGTTPDQIRGMMFYEAFLYIIAVIPLGIILGIFLAYIILRIVGGSTVGASVLKEINFFNIVFPSVISMLSIFIAVYNPAKTASNVSPIESITTADVNQQTKTLLSSSRTSNLNGFVWKMVYSNIKRYRKRFIATVISIGVGIAVFILSTYVVDFLNPASVLEDRVKSDYILESKDDMGQFSTSYGYNDDVVNEIKSIPGIKNVNVLKQSQMDYMLHEYSVTDKTIEECTSGKNLLGVAKTAGGYDIVSQVYGCSDEFMESLRDSVSDGDKKDESDVFIIQNLNNEDITKLKDGDIVTLGFNPFDNGKFLLIDKDIKIDHVLNKLPMNLNQMEGYIATFVPYKFLEDNYKISGYQKIEIYLDNNADIKQIESKLQAVADRQKNGQLVSYRAETEKWNDLQAKVQTTLTALVIIIMFFGLLNLMNTMNISIIVRKREFGMLRALGMTKREMMKMVLIEAFIYGITSSVIGIVTGLTLTDLVYNAMKRRLHMTMYINFKAVILTFITAIILSLCSVIMPLKKATSEDIVESIQAVE